MTPESRNIGMVFQIMLYFLINVMENICFGLGVDRNETMSKYILMLGLEGMEAKYPHELSGGQQQLAIGEVDFTPAINVVR